MAEETIEVLLGSGGFVRLVIEADWLAMDDEELGFVRSLAMDLRAFSLPVAERRPLVEPAPLERVVVDVNAGKSTAVKPPPVEKAKPKPARTSTGKAKFMCPDCGDEFDKPQGLGSHRRYTHGGAGLAKSGPRAKASAPVAERRPMPNQSVPVGARPKDPFKDEPKRTGLPDNLGPISKTPVPSLADRPDAPHFVGGRG